MTKERRVKRAEEGGDGSGLGRNRRRCDGLIPASCRWSPLYYANSCFIGRCRSLKGRSEDTTFSGFLREALWCRINHGRYTGIF